MARITDDEPKQEKGNTLDYYNDDMSRKAVGRLFDNIDQDDIVTNYDKDKEEEPALEKKVHSDRYSATDDYDISIYQRRDIKAEIEELTSKPKPKKNPEPAVHHVVRRPNAVKRTDAVKRPGAVKRQEAAKRMPVPEYDEDEQDEVFSISPIKTFVALAFVILTLILAMLIIKVNSSNKIIKENEGKVAKNEELQRENFSLQEENEKLLQDIEKLTAELESNKEQQPPAEGGSVEQQAESGDTSEQNKSYTVVSGDNLSKISKKFYGTPNRYQEIMQANSLTEETVKVGQVLIIP